MSILVTNIQNAVSSRYSTGRVLFWGFEIDSSLPMSLKCIIDSSLPMSLKCIIDSSLPMSFKCIIDSSLPMSLKCIIDSTVPMSLKCIIDSSLPMAFKCIILCLNIIELCNFFAPSVDEVYQLSSSGVS